MAIVRGGDAPQDIGADDLVPLESDSPTTAQPRFRFVVPGLGLVQAQQAKPAARSAPLAPRGAASSAAAATPPAGSSHLNSARPAPAARAPGYGQPGAGTGSGRSPVQRPALQSGITPTPEQQGVIDDEAVVVVAKALAGSGKTTSSVAFTVARPHEKTLYICFARANAEQARPRFPRHVDCSTGHAIAYRSLDARTRARLPKYWNARVLVDDLHGLTGSRPSWTDAAVISRLFQEFFADTSPYVSVDLHSARALAQDPRLARAKLEDCAAKANLLWADMCDLTGRARLPHDAYLKRFILGRPNLGYDRLIFEEAQDGNPLMAALVCQQLDYGAKLLIIGDPHQSIYKFRGAYNIFEKLPKGASEHTMTNTWRFGPQTADKVNLLMDSFKPNERARIVGCGQDRPWNDNVPTTYLARTNAKLFEMAVAHVEASSSPIYWVGGVGKYRVHMLLDAYALWEGRVRDVQDEFFRGFLSWEDLRKYGESTGDPDAKVLHTLVDQYRHRIPELVERIDGQVAETIERAAIGLGTGHSSKGLEFPQVALCDDFDKSFDRALAAYQAGQAGDEEEQEINLLYVALSRAQHCVRPNPGLAAWMDQERLRRQLTPTETNTRSMWMSDRP